MHFCCMYSRAQETCVMAVNRVVSRWGANILTALLTLDLRGRFKAVRKRGEKGRKQTEGIEEIPSEINFRLRFWCRGAKAHDVRISERIKTRCEVRTHAAHGLVHQSASMQYTDQSDIVANKMLSYRRETALQGELQFSPKVEHWNWETIFYGHYTSIFNHCDIIGLKICRIP